MSSLPGQPDNINFLSPLGFRFVIKKLPNVNYFCQNVAIPSVSMSQASYPNPVINIPLPGSKMTYEPLTIRFKVDEDMKNYLEVMNWLTGLGHPVSFDHTRDLSRSSPVPSVKPGSAASFVSDGTLVILTNHKNPNLTATFYDMFPISISELQFDSTDSDVLYLECVATFAYRSFSLATIG